MKKLERSEVESLALKPPGKSSYIRTCILNMKVGDLILVEPQDWHWKKKTPTALVARLQAHSKRRYSCLKRMDGKGWVVERLK